MGTATITSWVLARGRAFRCNDLAADPLSDHQPDARMGFKPQLTVPILGTNEQVLGALTLHNKPVGAPFTERDEALLTALAAQTAIALERTRLVNQAAAAAAALQAEQVTTELLNTVSHELHTPLGAIKGFASAMPVFGADLTAEERQGFLHEIEDAAGRLTHLVDSLLRAARVESVSLEVKKEAVAGHRTSGGSWG